MTNKYEDFMKLSKKEQKSLKIRNLAYYTVVTLLLYSIFMPVSSYFNKPHVNLALFMVLSSVGICIAYTITLFNFTRFKTKFDKDQKDLLTEIVSDARRTQRYEILNKVMFDQPLKTCWVIATVFNKSLIDFTKITHKKSEWVVDFAKTQNYTFEDLGNPEITWKLTNAFLKEALREDNKTKD